jgi:hypothetical protein
VSLRKAALSMAGREGEAQNVGQNVDTVHDLAHVTPHEIVA